jgi:hypothetical protein
MKGLSRGLGIVAAGWALIGLAGCNLDEIAPQEGQAVELPGAGVVDPEAPGGRDGADGYLRLWPRGSGTRSPYPTSAGYPAE